MRNRLGEGFKILTNAKLGVLLLTTLLAVSLVLMGAPGFMPGASATTADFYPNANAVDGVVGRLATSGLTFTNIRAAAGNVSDYTSTSFDCPLLQTGSSSGQYRNLYRGYITFDTSSIPDDVTIDSATVSMYVNSKQNNIGLSDANAGIRIVNAQPASPTVLVDSDYATAQFSMSAPTANDKTYAGITAGTYNVFTVNAYGLGVISKTGITHYGFVFYCDALGAASWASSQTSKYNMDFAGGAHPPRLTVTYHL